MVENRSSSDSLRRMTAAVAILAVLTIAACQAPDEGAGDAATATDSASESKPPRDVETSAGKPSAPIRIDYAVIGNAVVGQPVSINLEVSSTVRDTPIALNYRINDARNLRFPQAQPERVSLGALGDGERAREQVTVVPQRDGRLYLNVSAEIETEGGTMLKSMAIPIQVGRAPSQQQANGELTEDGDGEAVISMPAEESTPP